jgi:PAS domain S-box-containing protein
LGTIQDITEQVAAEASLKESENRFRVLAETLPQMVWVNSAEGAPEYMSGKWKEYFGKDAQEAWSTMIHPDDKENSEEAFAQSLKTGTSMRVEVRLQNREGAYRWHTSVAEPVKDESGKIVKWVGALIDIHDAKTIAERLEQQVAVRTKDLSKANHLLQEQAIELMNAREFLKTVLDSSEELVTAFDEELRFTFVNKKALQLMGKSAEEVLGQTLSGLYPGAVGSETYEAIEKALQGEVTFIPFRTSLTSTAVFLESYIQPMRQNESISGVVVLQRDISQFVQLTESLRQANEELLRSNEDLMQFAHVTSHDLKEPVRKIRIFAKMLEADEGQLSGRGKVNLHKVLNAADRMDAMISGVLLYSTLNADEHASEPIDLNEIISSVESDLELLIQQKSATISCGQLPKMEGATVLIHQLFYNLINNSLKFSRAGVPPHIIIEGSLSHDQVVITLEDNGIGFEADYAESIFKTFLRLNPKDKYEGTGLGLSLCKKIVERHGGNIEAAGKEGEWARFTITLPRRHKGIKHTESR